MLHYIFCFTDGDQERSFTSTFDAYKAILDESHCHGFLGARLAANDKEGLIPIVDAEFYVNKVRKVKNCLEFCCMSCMDDDQILEIIQKDYVPSATSLHPYWKQHMDEYSAGYDEWISRISMQFKCFDKDWIADDGRSKIPVPNDPFMIKVWQVANLMMDVCADDSGANLHRAKDLCLESAKRFDELSKLCIESAKNYQNEIELNELYVPDPDENWYNK